VHDSNSSLYFYRSLGHTDCTVVSTGTWVIIFNLRCPLEALNAERDTLCNITVDGELAATARFMGGREYDLLTQGARCAVDAAAIERTIARGQFALPSYAPGGPFPGGKGMFVGPAPETELERAAIGTLYLACMSDVSLRLIRSDNELIVDGGLAYNPAYLGLLAALRGSQPVLRNTNAEGSASGAAALAYEALGHRPPLQPCAPVTAWQVPGLAAYHARWLELAEAHARAGGQRL
jgi:sugar (pentulose or hexulose) kinase